VGFIKRLKMKLYRGIPTFVCEWELISHIETRRGYNIRATLYLVMGVDISHRREGL
jgi:hypothetical protein